ncbi:hypothetical protein Bbelb_366200 [Branchiostoma belcheri]|nr:hypothetical protein Bbelb_366200 [Branchiostoma belcheri]
MKRAYLEKAQGSPAPGQDGTFSTELQPFLAVGSRRRAVTIMEDPVNGREQGGGRGVEVGSGSGNSATNPSITPMTIPSPDRHRGGAEGCQEQAERDLRSRIPVTTRGALPYYEQVSVRGLEKTAVP